MVAAKIDRLLVKVSGKDGTEADMIELMEAMTEQQTASQLRKNLIETLRQPLDDLPEDDSTCSPADRGQ